VAERTVAYLDAHAKQGGDAPFFVQCSFPDPHHPFTPPGRYWDMYKAGDMALPDAFRLGNRPPPPHVAALQAARDDGTRVADAQPAFACTEREAREAIALTYGMIAMIDDNIAKVLKRLTELGLAKDTVVVFTSDHGDLMGDHQLLLKGNYAYQGLIRVPFIWAEPDGTHAGRRADGLFGTLDIAATMLDRAKITPYNGIQGKSALAAMNGGGGGESGHDGVLIEYGSQRPLHGTTGEMQMRTLVDKRWRITYYRGVSWGEMYDLDNDPLELDNLWDDPAAASAKRELTERLLHKMLELAERSPRPTRSA
jgi:arylsulfatase A-like enzyme